MRRPTPVSTAGTTNDPLPVQQQTHVQLRAVWVTTLLIAFCTVLSGCAHLYSSRTVRNGTTYATIRTINNNSFPITSIRLITPESPEAETLNPASKKFGQYLRAFMLSGVHGALSGPAVDRAFFRVPAGRVTLEADYDIIEVRMTSGMNYVGQGVSQNYRYERRPGGSFSVTRELDAGRSYTLDAEYKKIEPVDEAER